MWLDVWKVLCFDVMFSNYNLSSFKCFFQCFILLLNMYFLILLNLWILMMWNILTYFELCLFLTPICFINFRIKATQGLILDHTVDGCHVFDNKTCFDVMWYDTMRCYVFGLISCYVFDVMLCNVMRCNGMLCEVVWCNVFDVMLSSDMMCLMWCDLMKDVWWCDLMKDVCFDVIQWNVMCLQ